MKDYFNYGGKVCVVTGGYSGMGAALVERLVDCGAKVYMLDIKDPGRSDITFIETDLSSKESIDAAFTKLPEQFDKFFGCAGVSGLHTDFVTTMCINLLSTKYMTEQYLFDRVVEGGAIAYIASQGAGPWLKWKDTYYTLLTTETWEDGIQWLNECIANHPKANAYYVSKRGLVYYTKMIVAKFGQYKSIRVNCIGPGGTRTPLFDEFTKKLGSLEAQDKFRGAPDKYAEAYEMAEPLLCINSDAFSYVSGQNIVVDFGSTAMSETDTLREGRDKLFQGSGLGSPI